jgi:hypothetical protein
MNLNFFQSSIMANFRKANWIRISKVKGDIIFSFFYLKYYSVLYDIKRDLPIVDKKPFHKKKVTDRLKLEKTDHGVDGVFYTNRVRYNCLQSKFRSRYH